MKLLHVIAQKPERTGSGVFVSSIISEAAAAGWQQALIAGITAEDEVYLRNEYREKQVLFQPVLFETEGLSFAVPGMSDVMPYRCTRYRDMDEAMLSSWENTFEEKLIDTIRIVQPDLIISHHLWLLSALVVRVAGKIPVICVCHGTDLRQMELCPKLGAIARDGLRSVDKVLALTDLQAAQITTTYGIHKNRISVIGSAYNSSLFFAKEKTQNNQIKIIYAGKLSFSKGVISLLKAFELLSDLLPEINFRKSSGDESGRKSVQLILVGAGAGEEMEAIEKLALNCSCNVVLTGGISQKELSELFRNADLFVLPSFYEGLPLVLLEAIASGLRVVVTALPGLRQWIDEKLALSGTVTFVNLPPMKSIDEPEPNALKEFEQQLAQEISSQLYQLQKREGLPVQEINSIMHQYTWQAMYHRMEQIMFEVLARGKAMEESK